MRLGFPAARTRTERRPGRSRRDRRRPQSRADALRPYIGQWVATTRDEVVVGADTAAEVVGWLAEHGRTADSMFRVPENEEGAGGVSPL